MKKIRIELEKGKNVDVYAFSIFRFGAIKFKVDFVELKITRLYTIDYVMLSNWLAKNSGKTWKDYVKPDLLRLYNLLAGTKEIVDLMRKEAEE